MEYQPKLKTHTLFTLHLSFEGSYFLKMYLKDTDTGLFIYCCFMLSFTLPDIVFHKSLEFHSPLIEKRFLSRIFLSSIKWSDLAQDYLVHF